MLGEELSLHSHMYTALELVARDLRSTDSVVMLCRGSVRLYSDFYESDIIVASPLALATKLTEEEEEGTNAVACVQHRAHEPCQSSPQLHLSASACLCCALRVVADSASATRSGLCSALPGCFARVALPPCPALVAALLCLIGAVVSALGSTERHPWPCCLLPGTTSACSALQLSCQA